MCSVYYGDFLLEHSQCRQPAVTAKPFHIGELRHAGRLNQYHIRLHPPQKRDERRHKITVQCTADAPGAYLLHGVAAAFQQFGIKADRAEVVFDQCDFSLRKALPQQLLQQCGLARSKKAGNQIKFCHFASRFPRDKCAAAVLPARITSRQPTPNNTIVPPGFSPA